MTALTAWRDAEVASPTVTPLARTFLMEPSTLRRYTVARNGDVAAATAALRATLAWREEHVAPPLSCPACDVDPHSHCFFAIGHCTLPHARPIVYSCPRRAKVRRAALGGGAERLRAWDWGSRTRRNTCATHLAARRQMRPL